MIQNTDSVIFSPVWAIINPLGGFIMANATKSIAQRLFESERAINNSLKTPDILATVTLFGYNQPRIEAARALYEEGRALTELQEKEYGDQFEATQEVQVAWEKAAVAYSAALKIARIAFRGQKAAAGSLQLTGTRKQTLSGWLKQARSFYGNLLKDPALIAVMAAYSYDQTKLEAEAALVQAVSDASDAQDTERGQAQAATLARDAKLDELDQWVADYKAIAEVAFADSPQMLEQLGWVVKA
jgi:hypothetical protein